MTTLWILVSRYWQTKNPHWTPASSPSQLKTVQSVQLVTSSQQPHQTWLVSMYSTYSTLRMFRRHLSFFKCFWWTLKTNVQWTKVFFTWSHDWTGCQIFHNLLKPIGLPFWTAFLKFCDFLLPFGIYSEKQSLNAWRFMFYKSSLQHWKQQQPIWWPFLI